VRDGCEFSLKCVSKGGGGEFEKTGENPKNLKFRKIFSLQNVRENEKQ
jgi:hypothetical protein